MKREVDRNAWHAESGNWAVSDYRNSLSACGVRVSAHLRNIPLIHPRPQKNGVDRAGAAWRPLGLSTRREMDGRFCGERHFVM